MRTASTSFFKALLDKEPKKRREELLVSLTPEHKKLLALAPQAFYKDPIQERIPVSSYLAQIHIHWFTPYLRSLAKNDIRLFVSCLNPKQQEEIKEQLRFSNHFPQLKEEAILFLQKQLLAQVTQKQPDLLPIECLPQHPLNKLLECTLEELLQLVRFLGLKDIAHDLQFIIDRAKIVQIQTILEEKELSYLKSLMQEKESIAFKRIGLDKWEGDREQLNKIIHQRGLNRLAKALFHAEKSLFWYISHKFDPIDASILEPLYTDLNHPQGSALLVEQVATLTTLIQEKKL